MYSAIPAEMESVSNEQSEKMPLETTLNKKTAEQAAKAPVERREQRLSIQYSSLPQVAPGVVGEGEATFEKEVRAYDKLPTPQSAVANTFQPVSSHGGHSELPSLRDIPPNSAPDVELQLLSTMRSKLVSLSEEVQGKLNAEQRGDEQSRSRLLDEIQAISGRTNAIDARLLALKNAVGTARPSASPPPPPQNASPASSNEPSQQPAETTQGDCTMCTTGKSITTITIGAESRRVCIECAAKNSRSSTPSVEVPQTPKCEKCKTNTSSAQLEEDGKLVRLCGTCVASHSEFLRLSIWVEEAMHKERYEKAKTVLVNLTTMSPTHFPTLLQMSLCEAALNNAQKSVDWLAKALEHGLDVNTLSKDKGLKELRKLESYKQVVGKYEKVANRSKRRSNRLSRGFVNLFKRKNSLELSADAGGEATNTIAEE